MTGFEAAGDVITGGILGRTIEPKHGEGDGHTHETACLNCATPLAGPFCSACGQHSHVHRTLWALWHDIAHGVFHFEGKVWTTIPLLAWRPGDLTRRYIHGERAKFVSPLALFLFTVFLMFATFETVGGPIRPTVNLEKGKTVDAEDVAGELDKARVKVKALEAERARAKAAGKPLTAIDEALSRAQADVGALSAVKGMTSGISDDLIGDSIKIDTGSKEFDERVKGALKNPKLLLYKLQSSAYKFAWALIPLSLPFMWLIFAWRRQYKLYDHAVFVTHSLCFVMLLLITMALVAAAGGPESVLLLLIPAHFFRQLKQAYKLSWFSALWRTIVLLNITTIVLLMFGLALLALGVSG